MVGALCLVGQTLKLPDSGVLSLGACVERLALMLSGVSPTFSVNETRRVKSKYLEIIVSFKHQSQMMLSEKIASVMSSV